MPTFLESTGFDAINPQPNPQQSPNTVPGLGAASLAELERLSKQGMKVYSVNGDIQVENQSGQVVFSVPKSQMGLTGDPEADKAQLEAIQAQMAEFIGDGSGVVGVDADGNLYVDYGPDGPARDAPAGVKQHPGSKTGGGGSTSTGPGNPTGGPGQPGGGPAGNPTQGGGSFNHANTGGGGGFGGGGGGGNDVPGAAPPLGGPGPGDGGSGFSPSAVNDPGQRGSPGSGFFDTSALGSPGLNSLFDFLPDNYNSLSPEERQAALIGAVTRRQEQGLNNQVNRFDASQNERLQRGAGTRALEDRILGDTDVFDEGTIQRISGRNTQRLNESANTLADALESRRASAGSSRSGSAQTERAAIFTGAANQAAQGEADLRAQARQANFDSRNSALGAVGQSQRADVGLGADINRGAANAIGNAQVFGDAFLTQNALNGGQGGSNQPVFQTTQAGGATIRQRLT